MTAALNFDSSARRFVRSPRGNYFPRGCSRSIERWCESVKGIMASVHFSGIPLQNRKYFSPLRLCNEILFSIGLHARLLAFPFTFSRSKTRRQIWSKIGTTHGRAVESLDSSNCGIPWLERISQSLLNAYRRSVNCKAGGNRRWFPSSGSRERKEKSESVCDECKMWEFLLR